MKRYFHYKVAIIVALLFPFIVGASYGPDYTYQLNHSLKRWIKAMDYLHRKEKDVEVVYVCVNKSDAEQLSKEFSGQKQLLTEEKLLSYTSRLVVRHSLPPKKEFHKQWLRRQFFIGVAYHCDMDGLQEVERESL
jgi:hypothetical protein